MLRFWFCLIIASSCIFASNTYAVDTDFDGDGLSDLILANIASDNSVVWTYQSSSSGFTTNTSLGTLGTNGVLMTPGYWTTTTTPELGVATLDTTANTVTWSAVDATPTTHTQTFGTGGQKLVSGADYNGNGLTGAAIIPNSGAAQIYTDLFSSGTTVDVKFKTKYAKKGIAFYVRQNGQNDVLGLFRSAKGKKKYSNTAVIIDHNTLAETKIKYPKTKKKIQDVFPVAASNGVDNLAMTYKTKKNMTIVVYDLSKNKINTRNVNKNATLVVGEFLSDAGEEIGVYYNQTFTVYNPVTGTSSEYTSIPSGIAADQINITTLQSSSSSGGPSCDITKKPTDGNGGWLWKPVSDNGGKPVVLLPAGKNASSMSYVKSNGKTFQKYYFYSYSNPDRPTWRPTGGPYCSGYPKNGYVRYKMSGKWHCRKIKSPCARYD